MDHLHRRLTEIDRSFAQFLLGNLSNKKGGSNFVQSHKSFALANIKRQDHSHRQGTHSGIKKDCFSQIVKPGSVEYFQDWLCAVLTESD